MREKEVQDKKFKTGHREEIDENQGQAIIKSLIGRNLESRMGFPLPVGRSNH